MIADQLRKYIITPVLDSIGYDSGKDAAELLVMWYHNYPRHVQDALIDMRYNLGPNRFRKFKLMIKALERGDRNKAAKEMLDSKWAGQVGHRATELASIVSEDNDIGISCQLLLYDFKRNQHRLYNG